LTLNAFHARGLIHLAAFVRSWRRDFVSGCRSDNSIEESVFFDRFASARTVLSVGLILSGAFEPRFCNGARSLLPHFYCRRSVNYSEALAIVLMHELLHQNRGTPHAEAGFHGGLAAWQKRKVASYVEEHLTEQISLAKLADLARLSRITSVGPSNSPLECRRIAITSLGASSVQKFC
jgi:hypothetical protein